MPLQKPTKNISRNISVKQSTPKKLPNFQFIYVPKKPKMSPAKYLF